MNSQQVLDIFKEITRIPRESGHEEPMTRFLERWAEDRGLEHKTDAIGNVLIAKPASAGKESVPTLVLQAHQDMVCEKNEGVAHDFLTDPIRYVVKDGWMVAEDTTLGADDGIGIAACLALLESDLSMGRIECIFTISEETGMDGAEAMQEGFFTGKTLINLDSEDEGEMFIGCAGGVTTNIEFDTKRVALPEGLSVLRIKIGGGVGGHSGDDINKERVNTVQQMARFLHTLKGASLVCINGGGKHNAIARECEAVIGVADPKAVEASFLQFGKDLQAEYRLSDPSLTFTATPAQASECLEAGLAASLVRSLLACPHGVEAMSQDIKGLVETSTNLASVKTRENVIEICTSQRSSITSACYALADKVAACFELAGARIQHVSPYPGWKPNVDSRILKVCVESYKRLFGVEPAVKAIHAGLECGLFLSKFPGLDMISFGPTLRGVHAPGEKLELESLDKFTRHLEDVVTSFE